MNEVTRKQINELEKLAGEFIIGHKSMTDEQKNIMVKLEHLQKMLNDFRDKEKRIIRLINLLNNKLVDLN